MPKDKRVGQERKGPASGVVAGGIPGVKERTGVRGVGLGLFSHSYVVFWTQYHETVSSDLYPLIPIISITNRCGACLAAGTD